MKKEKKHILKHIWEVIVYDWKTLLLFEISYRFIALFFTYSIKIWVSFALENAGTVYLTSQNIFSVLSHPLSLLLLLFILILIGFYVYIEVVALATYTNSALENKKISIFSLWKDGLRNGLYLLKPSNLWIILLLFLIPLTAFPITSGLLGGLKIPGFILEYIDEHTILQFIFHFIRLGMTIFVAHFLFCLPNMVFHHMSFKKARNEAKIRLKNNRFRLFWYLILSILLINLIYALLNILTIFLVLVISRITQTGIMRYSFFLNVSSIFYHLGKVFLKIFEVVAIVSSVMVMYRSFGAETELKIKKNPKKKRKLFHVVEVLTILGLLFIYESITTFTKQSNLFQQRTTITAHRAGAMFAPENTIMALQSAIDTKAEYAEIDVQQTKDGTLIILHDTNFKRTTGINKNVWDVTYDEVLSYNAAAYLEDGTIAPVPTLEEMLMTAKGKIKLMIELKGNGREKDIVLSTIQLIQKYDMEGECIIASSNYRLLEEVKAQSTKIPTMYIIAIAYGKFYKLKAVDMYSIEATFATPGLISGLHSIKKPVYVWTVNEEEQMRRLFSLKVDGIITDNTYLGNYVLKTKAIFPLNAKLIYSFLGLSPEEVEAQT